MKKQLLEYITECELYEKQRVFWLRISGFVALAVLLIVAEWHMVDNTKIEWLLVSFGMTVILVWWYWTMMIIRRLLLHKKVTSQLLISLADDFDELAKKIRENR